MTRTQELRSLANRINRLAPTDTETVMVFALLCEGKSHRELADKRGIRPGSSKTMMYRFRKRARAHGIVVPSAFRRCGEPRTLAQVNARKAG